MISKKGQSFIQSWEKCALSAFKDEAGIWTIGFGSIQIFDSSGKKRNVISTDVITQGVANFLFQQELDGISNFLVKSVQLDLLQIERDALVSFIYNVGQNAFKSSSLRKLVIQGIRDERLEAEFKKWKFIHKDGKLLQLAGLLSRRISEYKIYKDGVYVNHE